jgi:ferrous iron transport protein B
MAVHYLINHENFPLDHAQQELIENIKIDTNSILPKHRQKKSCNATPASGRSCKACGETGPLEKKLFTDKLDNLLLHRVWGYVILLVGFVFIVPEYFLARTISDGRDRMDIFKELAGWLNIYNHKHGGVIC